MNGQLRHADYGLFQGMVMGLAFWWPMSDMPELGIYKFDNQDEAQGLIRTCQANSPQPECYSGDKWAYEPFNEALHNRLILAGEAATKPMVAQ